MTIADIALFISVFVGWTLLFCLATLSIVSVYFDFKHGEQKIKNFVLKRRRERRD